MTVKYILTIHVCGGSQAEAAQPELAFGPFDNYDEAVDFGDFIYYYASSKDDAGYICQEMIPCVTEVTNSPKTLADLEAFLTEQYNLDEEEDDINVSAWHKNLQHIAACRERTLCGLPIPEEGPVQPDDVPWCEECVDLDC